MMRVFSMVGFGLLSLAMVSGVALGHGIPLEVDADPQKQLHSTARVIFSPHDSELTPFPVDAPALLRGTVGFYPAYGGGIPAGTVLTVDAAGGPQHPQALAYWNGGAVLPSPVTVGLTRTGVSFQVGPLDTLVAGGALGAYNGEVGGHSSFTLTLPLDAPVGMYALGFQATAPGFTRSETFWAIANNGLAESTAARGAAAIGVAVPEPSTLVLGGLGVLGLLAARRTRRR